jgi:hypothetical protein
MPKSDLLRRNDQRTPIVNGELVPVATVVQVQQITLAGPFVGDLQITNGGRLIVGNSPDLGARLIVSDKGMLGYNANGLNTFSLWASTYTDPAGASHVPGDLHLGNLAENYLRYDQATGTLGLYTPQGAGFIARRDGTLQAGLASGAHMLWNAAEGALQVRYADDVRIALEASGDAFFDGTVNASGGRIYGLMVVDDILRAGDVDGPAVYLGKFSRENGSGDLIETAEIIATDDHNLPWFHVVAGGETLPGYFHLGGTGQYAQQLSYDGTTLTLDGTIIAQAGTFAGVVAVGPLGALTWANGKGRADATGISHTESVASYWHVKPAAAYFMEINTESNAATYNSLRVNESDGIAGYFSGGYVGLYARSATDQIGVWGYAADLSDPVGVIPDLDTTDPDKTDGIEALTPGVSIYGLTDAGTAGRFVATDGGRGVVAKTNSTDQAALLAWNTSTGPALHAQGYSTLGDGGTTNYTKFSDTGVMTFVGSAYAVPRFAIVVKTADYVATDNDSVIVCNKTAAMTITLPAATGSGKWIAIKSINTGTVTIDGNGSDTIDGQATQTINQWDGMQIVDYAANAWTIV